MELEPISKMPQKDADASEVHEPKEVLCVPFMARDESPEVVQPSEQALHLPAVLVAAERPTVLRGRSLPVGSVRRNHLDPPFLPQTFVQSIAVVGTIADQPVGGMVEEAVVNRLVHECDLMRRSTCNPSGDRKTEAV